MSRLPQTPSTDADLTLRAATLADVDPIATLFAESGVRRWWNEMPREEIQAGVGEHLLAAESNGAVVAVVHAHEDWERDWRAVSFDIAVAPERQGRGIGRRVLRLAAAAYAELGHHRATIDPSVENEPAIRCYRAAGFEVVGVLRRAWWSDADERWHDCLLMDQFIAPPPGVPPA